jgi:hypothetical protein
MTAQDAPGRATGLGRRAYGGNTADGPAVRGVRTYGGAAGADSAQPRAGRRVGAWVGSGGAHLGPGAASEGAARKPEQGRRRAVTAARGRARRRGVARSGPNPFAGALFKSIFLQKFE